MMGKSEDPQFKCSSFSPVLNDDGELGVIDFGPVTTRSIGTHALSTLADLGTKLVSAADTYWWPFTAWLWR